MTTYTQKITFGEMRASGVRDVLVYCREVGCSHSKTMRRHCRPYTPSQLVLRSQGQTGIGRPVTAPRAAL
jgi:hypothetical protein